MCLILMSIIFYREIENLSIIPRGKPNMRRSPTCLRYSYVHITPNLAATSQENRKILLIHSKIAKVPELVYYPITSS